MAIPVLTQEESIVNNFKSEIISEIIVSMRKNIEEEIHNQLKNTQLKNNRVSPAFVVGINHRGWHQAPENTLTAFKESKQNGFEFVETDVRFTFDGVPVLLHDSTINRTARNTDGTAIDKTVNIREITYEEALKYDFGIWKGNQFSGTRIAGFNDFILLCKRLKMHPFIELMEGSREEISFLVETVKQYGMKGHVTWISFSSALLDYVKECDESASLGYLVIPPVTEKHISVVKDLRTEFNYVFLDSSRNLDKKDIQMCIEAGIPLMVWIVNSEADILSLDPYVSGVTSDRLNVNEVFQKHYLP